MTSAMSLDSRSIRVKTAYKIEVLKNDQWIDSTALIIRGNDVYFAGTHVERFLYNEAVNSAAMTFNIHGQSCHANLFFTDAKQGFIGRYWDEQGNSLLIRGSLGYTELFLTKKRPLSDPRAGLESWLSFGIETHWDDFGGKNPTLVVKYTLGDYDVSNRTRVTHVDKAEGTTTIEMVKALLPFQMTFDDEIDDTSFTIVLQPGGEEFAGELNLQDELFELTGQLEDPAAQIQSSKLAAMAGAGEPGSVAAGSIQTPEMFYSTPTMSIQQLDSVSSIQRGKGENGAEYTYDAAQAGAGEYFNESLINGLDDEWVTSLYGKRCTLPEGVQDVFNRHKTFFQENSVLGTGQLLYSNFQNSDRYKKTMESVSANALEKGWKDLSGSKQTAPEYRNVTNDLYCQGYRYNVTGIQPYLQDDPAGWGRKYYDFLVSEKTLTTWQIQIASHQFMDTTEHMYEWHTKLAILNPDGSDLPEKMLGTVYASLLGVYFTQAGWDDDIEPILTQVIQNAVSGNFPEGLDELQKQILEDNRKALLEMIACYGMDVTLFCRNLASAFRNYRIIRPDKSMYQIVTDKDFLKFVGDHLGSLEYDAWSELTKTVRCKGVLKGVGYALGGAVIIFGIFMNSQRPADFNSAVQDMSLGILALGALTKSIETVMNVGMGNWMRNYAVHNDGRLAEFAGDLAKWFSKNGEVVPVGRCGKFFTAIFGDNAATFFAKRMAPALAIMGLVLCSVSLFHAIQSGNTADIVFDSLFVFFALADSTLMFLSMGGFAWAGALGFGVAIAGLILVIVNILYNILVPKPDPVKDFVHGPMKAKGFAV